MRDWTFMVYMAGDNGKVFDDGGQLMHDLQVFGWRDLAEMSQVGSTDQVAIVAQYDTLAERQYTPRFYIDGSQPSGQLVEKIPQVNTGDPTNLANFITWGATNYPARHYALILWNHGSGWKEDDIYARYREKVEKAVSRGETRAGAPGEGLHGTLFMSTAGQIMSIDDDETRAICYDDSSMDFLDNREMVKALSDAEARTGQRLSLLGMDACLMSMLEVAYQVREHVGVMVGSQENEPGDGWPYSSVLRGLVDNPDMSPQDLGRHIVTSYGDYYFNQSRGGAGGITQSAVDLDKVEAVGQGLGRFARLLTDIYDQDYNVERALNRAQKDTQRFRGDKDYVDLRHFLAQMDLHYTGSGPVAEAIGDMQKLLATGTGTNPVIANIAGLDRANAHGLSLYLPNRDCSIYYDNLEFADLGWRDLIYKHNRVERSTES